jgi:hypothetical protein
MTTKKTVRVPLAADGVPTVVSPQQLDKTRELPAYEAANAANALDEAAVQAAPREILDDDITVPVHSSIESTLTFELLRRQSTETDEVGERSGDEVGGGNKA